MATGVSSIAFFRKQSTPPEGTLLDCPSIDWLSPHAVRTHPHLREHKSYPWPLLLLQLLLGLPALGQGAWQPSFSIPNLSPAGPLFISERHRALIRATPGHNEIVFQNYRTGETNRILTLPSGLFSMALSPNQQWLYVVPVDPALPQGWPATNILEFNLLVPGESRTLNVPERIVSLVPTDRRLVVLNVVGISDAVPYRLRVLDAVSGRLGPATTASTRFLAPSIEQDSVFADAFFAPTLSEPFRHGFDPSTLAWSTRRRFPVIRGEEGEQHGVPFAYTPDQRMLLTPVGIYTNAPNDASIDLRRLNRFSLYSPMAAFFDPRAPRFCLIGERNELSLLRTDRWESTKGYSLGAVGDLGAVAYGRDEDDIIAVFFLAGDSDGKVARFRPPLDLLATNAPPIAQLTLTNTAPTTAAVLLLDASASADDITPKSQLLFRWDLDGDGQFEIPFTNSPFLLHRFAHVGPLKVRVQVEDELGERSQASIDINLAFATVPSNPLPPATPWQFGFGVANAVFDLPRNRAFAVDSAGHRIVEINTDTGHATREYPVDSAISPPALALSPDGRHLYCAEIHRRPLLPTDYNNAYLVQFDLEAGVRAREVRVGSYVISIAVLSNLHIACTTASRLEVRQWPDATPVASVGTGSFPASIFATRPDGTLYWSQLIDATLSLRRRVFSPELGTLDNPFSFAIPALGGSVFGEGRYLLLNTGQVRALTPEAPLDFPRVTNIVAEPFRHAVDLPGRQLIALRGEGHWEFLRTSDWSRLVIQPAPSLPTFAFAAGDARYLYEFRHESPHIDPTGGSTLERRRVPTTDPLENDPPVLSWVQPPALIQLGTNLLVTAFAFDEDGTIADRELLVNGAPLPPLPDTFPLVPGRRQWRWTPTAFGTYRLQVTARDNLGGESRLAEHLIRVNQAPTVDFTLPFTNRQESPITFEFAVAAFDADDRVVSVNASYTSSNGMVRHLGSLPAAPFLFQVDRLVGREGVITVTAVDETGAKASKSVGIALDPPPGDNFAKPLPLAGTHATTGFAARQMQPDAIPLAEPPDPAVGVGTGGVWWRWTAPADLVVQIDTLGSSFDTLLRVLTTNRPAMIVDENNDDPLLVPASRVKFSASVGEVFLLGVLSPRNGETGDIRLNLRSAPWAKPEPAAPPTNDLFTARATLATGIPAVGTTAGARWEFFETALGYRSTNTVWYQWTAPESGWARFELTSTNIDPRLTLFQGAPSLTRLRALDSKDDNTLADPSATLSFPVIAGSNYVLRVNGVALAEGPFQLVVHSPVDPPSITNSPHDRLALARPISGGLADFESTSRDATPEAALQDALKLAEPVNGVWWRWTPETDGRAYWSLRQLTGVNAAALTRRVLGFDQSGKPQVLLPPTNQPSGSPIHWPTVAGTTYYLFAGTSGGRSTAGFRFFINNHMLTAPLRLLPPERTPGGNLRLGMHSPFERRATLESSSNLHQWRVVSPVILQPGDTTFNLPPDSPDPEVFFRLQSDD